MLRQLLDQGLLRHAGWQLEQCLMVSRPLWAVMGGCCGRLGSPLCPVTSLGLSAGMLHCGLVWWCLRVFRQSVMLLCCALLCLQQWLIGLILLLRSSPRMLRCRWVCWDPGVHRQRVMLLR